MSAYAEALADHRAELAELGEDILIRRYSGTPRVAADTSARARVTGYMPKDIVGSVVQGDRRVIVLADTLSSLLPILTSDKVVVRGRELAIKAVDDSTRRIAGQLVALELQVSG